jgi:hypothetical protein
LDLTVAELRASCGMTELILRYQQGSERSDATKHARDGGDADFRSYVKACSLNARFRAEFDSEQMFSAR